jgi:MoxR-like ATPase
MSIQQTTEQQIAALTEEAARLAPDLGKLFTEVSRVIVGQDHLVRRLVMALLCEGHVLLEGVPGLAKTLSVRTLAEALSANFRRIQFTPDLLPSDVVGTVVYRPQTGEFVVRRGPVFANLVLADEINRAPAKVQSALLEAMQERQVTLGDATHPLPDPFVVLATQNPIEQEGTYPLPEAQIDRFMFKVVVTYPDRAAEVEIVRRMTAAELPHAGAAGDLALVQRARELVHRVYVDDRIFGYVVDIVAATRTVRRKDGPPLVEYGASPRAAIWLTQAAKAEALLQGRGYVVPGDVKLVAEDVLRHRVIITYEGEAEGVTPEAVVQGVLQQVKVP